MQMSADHRVLSHKSLDVERGSFQRALRQFMLRKVRGLFNCLGLVQAPSGGTARVKRRPKAMAPIRVQCLFYS